MYIPARPLACPAHLGQRGPVVGLFCLYSRSLLPVEAKETYYCGGPLLARRTWASLVLLSGLQQRRVSGPESPLRIIQSRLKSDNL